MIKSAFMIAGTHSGCGKTTVSLGIMAALIKRGIRVQPFKVGPDFIDPGYHALVTGRVSHNLDGWIMDQACNRNIFSRYAHDADVAVVEGVMGLYDGFSGRNDTGSSAHMSKWLGIPVILVVDARSMARSAAAVALGFKSFDKDLNVAGVVFNRLGSTAHGDIIREAMKNFPDFSVLGTLPRDKGISIPSRHLGLITVNDLGVEGLDVQGLAEWIEESIDMDALLAKTRWHVTAEHRDDSYNDDFRLEAVRKRGRDRKVGIAVALDKAFCFYYQENIRLLEEAGAEIVFFSPMRDKSLPPGVKGVILGGGYPELHVERLSLNRDLIHEIRRAAFDGMPIYAECGGFMFLMEEFEDIKGDVYPLAGIFPFRCRMENRLKALGYREVTIRKDSVLGPAGTVIRGHEFHYSYIYKTRSNVSAIYMIADRKGISEREDGFQVKRVLGSYVHFHWGSNPAVARNFVEYCRRYGG